MRVSGVLCVVPLAVQADGSLCAALSGNVALTISYDDSVPLLDYTTVVLSQVMASS